MTFFQPAHVGAIIRSQFLEFRRDFGAVFLTVVFPLFFVVVLVAGSLTASGFKVDFAVVGAGASADARAFESAIAARGIGIKAMDRMAALAQLSQGTVRAVIVLPAQGLHDRQHPAILLVDPNFAQFAGSLVQAARAELLLKDGALGDDYTFRTETPPTSGGSQFSFIFPGMLALSLIQIGVFLTATPVLKAREKGTLRYLLLTPLTVPDLIAGQVIFRAAVALCQIMLLMILGSLVVHLSALQWLEVFGVASLGCFMLVTIGYALAGIPSSVESGMTAVMILNFAMMFGGNIFWDPRSSLPLQIFAYLMPPSYVADLFRQIVNGAPGLLPPALDLLAILGFTIAVLIFATRTFSFDTRREYRRPRLRASVA